MERTKKRGGGQRDSHGCAALPSLRLQAVDQNKKLSAVTAPTLQNQADILLHLQQLLTITAPLDTLLHILMCKEGHEVLYFNDR